MIMITLILSVFIISLVMSLLITPLAGWMGKKLGGVDIPDERKVHTGQIPRTGGIAIFIVFPATLIIGGILNQNIFYLPVVNQPLIIFLCGGIVAFGIGLADDFLGLNPKIKLLFQIIAATFAFWSGFNISDFEILGFRFEFGPISYLITVFWFVLLINAVNLIDGLDGLAGGIIFFVCAVMALLTFWREEFRTTILFVALGGSVLGFLRYNFNPASIFLGDGGSYFLGYVMAGLAIKGAIKSEVGLAAMIPLLALGIPLFDTILSPLRRFLTGKRLFQPDNGHLHHRLLAKGLSAKSVVWVFYLITLSLCLVALLLVNIRNEQVGLFFIALGAASIVGVRKFGYFEYLAYDKVYGWLRDLSDEAGISSNRRTFLSLQIDISRSKDINELWQHMTRALEMLSIDDAAFYLNKMLIDGASRDQADRVDDEIYKERRVTPYHEASVVNRKSPPQLRWHRKEFNLEETLGGRCFLRIEIPLIGKTKINFGVLAILKDLRNDNLSPYVLRRVEQLRRSITETLDRLREDAILTREKHDSENGKRKLSVMK